MILGGENGDAQGYTRRLASLRARVSLFHDERALKSAKQQRATTLRVLGRDPREMSKPLSSPRTRLYVYARIYIMYVSSPRLRIISKSERLTCGRAASLFLARLRRTVRSFRFLRVNESSMEMQELEGTERPSSRYDSFERKPDIHLEILICFPWLFFTGVYNLSQLYMNKWK